MNAQQIIYECNMIKGTVVQNKPVIYQMRFKSHGMLEFILKTLKTNVIEPICRMWNLIFC